MFSYEMIEQEIMQYILRHTNATCKLIFWHISQKRDISLAYVYRILGKMIAQQKVVKVWKCYLPHEIWMHQRIQDVELMRRNYLTSDIHIPIPNIWQQYVEHKTNTAYDQQILRTDISMKVVAQYKEKMDFWYYNSHPYHILWAYESERTAMNEFWKYVNHSYFLFWNTTYLDIYWSELLNLLNWYSSFCEKESWFLEEWYMVNIYWSYIIETLRPKKIRNFARMIFDTVQSKEDFDSDYFQQIFSMKESFTLKIIYDEEKAEILRKKVKRHVHKLGM